MRPLFLLIGVIALLIGIVWVLQGADILLGSFMSGSGLWLAIGAVLVVLGMILLAFGARAPGAKKAT